MARKALEKISGLEVPLPHKPPTLPPQDILLQFRTEIIAQRKLSYVRLLNLPLSPLLPWFPTLSPTDQCLSLFGRWEGEFSMEVRRQLEWVRSLSGYVGPKDRTYVVILVGSTFICELACQPPLLSKREYLGDGIHVASQTARQTLNCISDIRVLGLNSLTPYS